MGNQTIQREVKAFENTIESFRDQWRSIDIRVVAMKGSKEEQSSFQNAATTITLLPTAPREGEPPNDLPDLPWLKAVHESKPIEDLKSILSELAASGIVRIRDIDVSFVSNDSSAWFGKEQRGERYISSPSDWTSYTLILDSKFALPLDPRKVDEELKGNDSPFLSLDELIQEFPLWRGRGGNFRGLCQINAFFGMRIAETRWENDNLKIVVEQMPSWDIEDVSLGLIYTLRSGSKLRRSQEIKQLSLGKEDRLEVELKPPEDLVAATILLRTRRTTLDQTTVFHPALNWRLNLYELFDRDLERLRSWLSLEGDSSVNFEIAVESLLFLCGYSVAPFVRHFHQQGRTDVRGIDCLATDPRRNLLVVECTTGPVDSKKLENLRYRNTSLVNCGHIGSPVLFTTVTRESVSKEVRKKAQDEKISLLAREDIEVLLSMVKRNASLDETREFIYGCIPT